MGTTTNMPASKQGSAPQQTGAATLFISLGLLLAITVMAFTGSKSARMEQLISANEYRTLEAFHAAEAGLEYGVVWLVGNKPTWITNLCDGESARMMTKTAPDMLAGNGDTYHQTITYCQFDARRPYILVRATSVASQDATITANVQQYVRPNTILSPKFALNTPPIVVNGCIHGITGTPDVYPGAPGELAVVTSQPHTADCIDTGHLDIHGGTIEGDAFSSTAWQYIFGDVSKAEFQSLAQAEAAAEAAESMARSDRHYFWITDTSQWHENMGTPTHPVVLAFATVSSCPKINGNVTLYGVVYYEDARCGNQGWGGAEIFGTASFESDLTKFTANAVVQAFDLSGSGGEMDDFFPYVGAPKILGTWKDF